MNKQSHQNSYKEILTFCSVFLLFATSGFAQERIEMEGTSITGNRESPKVLYIVPWQAPETVRIKTPPIYSIIDESLQPVERKSFKRQIEYYNQAYSKQIDTLQPDTTTQSN